MELPNDEIMKKMASMAIESATEDLAKYAEQFAEEISERGLTGPEALKAFAGAIRARNSIMYPSQPVSG